MERRLRRTLNRVTLLALSVLAMLVLLAGHVTEIATERQTRAFASIFLHARQASFSLRVAALVEELAATPDRNARMRVQAELMETLDLLSRTQLELVAGGRAALSPGMAEIQIAPRGLAERTANFVRLVRYVVKRDDATVTPARAAEVRHTALRHLVPMQQRAARQAEIEARQGAARLLRVERATFATIVLVILLQWLFLFRPLAARMAQKSAALERLVADEEHRAHHDPLTGLPNRRYLARYMEEAWEAAARRGERVAVCHIDLDRFKAVNDHFGHSAGDAVLRHVAEVLRTVTRERDFVARVGGDEFVIVVPAVRSEADLLAMSERIIRDASRPIPVTVAATASIGASAGIAVAHPETARPEQLLVDADAALNASKRAGKGRSSLFTDALRGEEQARETLRTELSRAVAEDRIVALFQPQVELAGGAPAGFEALLRWNHPARGLLSPQHFLGVAEESGIIDEIGRCLIGKALDTVAAWGAAGHAVPVLGLNLSVREISDPKFADWLKWEIDRREIEPRGVAIEIPETILDARSGETALRNVRALADLGCRIDLDDFGTGDGSIASLVRLRVGRVKLDRSILEGADRDPERARVARALVAMARNLGVAVLAEGIEAESEAALARALGCDHAQGYHVAPPMEAAAALAWLGRITCGQGGRVWEAGSAATAGGGMGGGPGAAAGAGHRTAAG
jgi:diguanylate cyclase (GGDEF)-like protein